MEYVRFGRTGLKVSRLCLGTMTFGFQADRATSVAIMDAATDAGITFFDTADMYPNAGTFESMGTTESIIGEWMHGRRDEFILASKCFFPTGKQPWKAGNSRHNIVRSIEASLRRLQTDYLDLYQLHAWDPTTPIEETLSALDDLVRSGKVRYVGCSNMMAWRIARAIGRSETLGLCKFESVQPRYNLLFRGTPTEGTRFTLGTAAERYRERYWDDAKLRTVDAFQQIAEDAGIPMTTLAVRWILANPVVTSPILGASRPEQLTASIAALETPLDADVLQQLNELTYEYRFGDNER